MKKTLLIILFLTGITPVFKNNSLNLGCSQAYAQDMNGGELEEVFICSNKVESIERRDGDWLIEESCHLDNEDGVATNPCVEICEQTNATFSPIDPCIDPNTGEDMCNSGDPDPNQNPGGGGGSGGGGSGGGDDGSDDGGDDDGDGGYFEIVCTKTCPSGYKLDEEICECKKDCKEGEYEQAIRNKDIIFTKKYGWVDLTHAFRDTSRDSPIGVNNLWNQLKNPPSQSQIYMGYYSVNYKQDVVVAGVSIGIERQFLVRPDLTLEERKSVALAIFQNVSTAFELLQSMHPTSTSSFEPADLPSNMLNFYRHVAGLTQEQILNAIEPVSIEQSIEVLKSNPCTFASDEYKNRSFEPFRFETPYTSQNFGVPDMLNTIEPFEVRPATDFGNADLILLEQDIISN